MKGPFKSKFGNYERLKRFLYQSFDWSLIAAITVDLFANHNSLESQKSKANNYFQNGAAVAVAATYLPTYFGNINDMNCKCKSRLTY